MPPCCYAPHSPLRLCSEQNSNFRLSSNFFGGFSDRQRKGVWHWLTCEHCTPGPCSALHPGLVPRVLGDFRGLLLAQERGPHLPIEPCQDRAAAHENGRRSFYMSKRS
ncbi:hypothetical protein AKJ16_DCAP05315 [Drosera capensis]